MSSFGKRIDGPEGRRRAARREVAILGSATTIQGSSSVVVEDICPAGARLFGRRLPLPGKDIFLRTDNLAVLGRVAWADEDERGMTFDAPLPRSARD